jgi:hypothetical protein
VVRMAFAKLLLQPVEGQMVVEASEPRYAPPVLACSEGSAALVTVQSTRPPPPSDRHTWAGRSCGESASPVSNRSLQ